MTKVPNKNVSSDTRKTLSAHDDKKSPTKSTSSPEAKQQRRLEKDILNRNTFLNSVPSDSIGYWWDVWYAHKRKGLVAPSCRRRIRMHERLLEQESSKRDIIKPLPLLPEEDPPVVEFHPEDPESNLYWAGSGVPMDKYFGLHPTALPNDAVRVKINRWASGLSNLPECDSDASFDDDFGYGFNDDDDERILTDEDEPTPALPVWEMTPHTTDDDRPALTDDSVLEDNNLDTLDDEQYLSHQDEHTPALAPTDVPSSITNVDKSSASAPSLDECSSDDSEYDQDSCDDDDSERDDTDADAPTQALALNSRKIRRLGENAEQRSRKMCDTGRVPRPRDSRINKRKNELSIVRDNHSRVQRRLESANGTRTESWLSRRCSYYSEVMRMLEEELRQLRHAKKFPDEWAEDQAELLKVQPKQKSPVRNKDGDPSSQPHTDSTKVSPSDGVKKRRRDSLDDQSGDMPAEKKKKRSPRA